MTLTTSDLPAALPIADGHTHKAAPGEILLTGWFRTGDDTFAVTAQWPADHGYYLHHRGSHDPMLIAETIRQCVPLLCHAAYDVPLDHRQIWNDLQLTAEPAALVADGLPVELVLHLTCGDLKRPGGRLRAGALHAEVTRVQGGVRRHLASVDTRFTSHAPAVYRRLRGAYADLAHALAGAVPLPPPIAPALVARPHAADVVLSPTGTPSRWQLRCDTTHPVLFDHLVDHAPGMLLLEAARQAAQTLTDPLVFPTAISCTFIRYAELDTPVYVTAALRGDTADVTVHQHDAPILTATFALPRLAETPAAL